jgi:TPP-dependent pyruvate/acetoin dehydrogenase alpha subunit
MLFDLYQRMLLIRKFEYAVKDLFARNKIIGALHIYAGEEAVAVGSMANLLPQDYITSTHRGHGHLIARGVSIDSMMAELFGKESGLCHGKGGSMHMADMKLHIFAQPVVGGGLPLAVGAALNAKLTGNGAVALSFFGDGGANQGCSHEAMNLAAIWRLPVVFICENNKYAEATPASYSVAGGSIAKRAAAYGIPGKLIDGMNVLSVYNAVKEMVERARSGEGPSLIEFDTYRFEGHEEGDPWATYRTKSEVEEWKKRDPITNLANLLASSGLTNTTELSKMESDTEKRIANAISFAENSLPTRIEEAFSDVFTDS